MSSYLWQCQNCEVEALVTRRIDDRDIPPRLDEGSCLCYDEGDWLRKIEAAGITRRTYVAGTKRKGFAELKEAVALEVVAAEMPHEKRADINREIHKLKSTKKE